MRRSPRALAGASVALGALLALPAVAIGAPSTVYVSPSGDDRGTGAADSPLKNPALAVKQLAESGGTVRLAAGTYPQLVVRDAQRRRVTIVGPDAARGVPTRATRPKARFAGASLSGAGNLEVRRVAFDGRVGIGSHPVLQAAQRADRIDLREVEATGGGNCIVIRAARRVRVQRSWIHDCAVGVALGGGNGLRADGISLAGNLVQRMSADGITFGNADHVTVEQNTIEHVNDPEGKIHNDGLQMVGNSDGTVIRRNHLYATGHHFLMLQAVVGPNRGLTIENNVMHRARAFGMQITGMTGLRFVNNTAWDTGWSALLLRNKTGLLDDAVIANNILSGLAFERAAPKIVTNNLLRNVPAQPVANGVYAGDPGFRDLAGGDLALAGSSPARAAGAALYAPRVDWRGNPRSTAHPTIGAIE